MSLHSELNSLVASLLAGTRTDTGRFAAARHGLTQGAATFDVRPTGADPFSWERRAEGLRANLRYRFAVELRETAIGRGEAARETLQIRLDTLVAGLADTANLPPDGAIGQIVPGAPVIGENADRALTARLDLIVMEK